MDPDALWAILIKGADSDPQERRDAAFKLLVWLANYGYTPAITVGGERPGQRRFVISICESVIVAEFEYADRLAGR